MNSNYIRVRNAEWHLHWCYSVMNQNYHSCTRCQMISRCFNSVMNSNYISARKAEWHLHTDCHRHSRCCEVMRSVGSISFAMSRGTANAIQTINGNGLFEVESCWPWWAMGRVDSDQSEGKYTGLNLPNGRHPRVCYDSEMNQTNTVA